MKKNIKTILIVVGALIAAVVVYSVFFSNKTDESGGTLISGNTSQPVDSSNQAAVSGVNISQEFVSLLLNLKKLNLDTSLFQDPVFQSLKDKTISFEDPGGQGRPNPFAPIGSDFVPESDDNVDQNNNDNDNDNGNNNNGNVDGSGEIDEDGDA
jgi:hypothetical protein